MLLIMSCDALRKKPAVIGTWKSTYQIEHLAGDLHMTLTLRSDRYFTLEREFYPEAVQEGKKVGLHVMLTEKGRYRHRDDELVLQVKDLKIEPQNETSHTFMQERPEYDFGLSLYQSERYHLSVDSLTSHMMKLTDLTQNSDIIIFRKKK